MKLIYIIFLVFFILIFSLISIYITSVNPQFLDTKIFRKESTANIYIQNDQLKIDFQIIDEDFQKAANFSNNLGISSDWLLGVSLTLDQRSLFALKQVLPLNPNLNFSDNSLNFSSTKNSDLNSSLPVQNYEISTGSAKLTLSVRGSNDYNLEVIQPDLIVKFATISGQVYLSSQVEQLFPIMSKIAKIVLVVKGKNVSGNILLK